MIPIVLTKPWDTGFFFSFLKEIPMKYCLCSCSTRVNQIYMPQLKICLLTQLVTDARAHTHKAQCKEQLEPCKHTGLKRSQLSATAPLLLCRILFLTLSLNGRLNCFGKSLRMLYNIGLKTQITSPHP